MLPILYSFRRCPYAIRARLALALTGMQFELREVLLKDKPVSLLEYSPAGTVPVLVLNDGTIINESIDVIRWATQQLNAHQQQDVGLFDSSESLELIEQNDGEFKYYLDRYKYFDRYPEHPQSDYLSKCETFMRTLENSLSSNKFLCDDKPSFTDLAIFPFVRQFAFVDPGVFDDLPYPKLQNWLEFFLGSELFKSVMLKYSFWQPGDETVIFQGANTQII